MCVVRSLRFEAYGDDRLDNGYQDEAPGPWRAWSIHNGRLGRCMPPVATTSRADEATLSADSDRVNSHLVR